jgi:flagellar biosynthesis component FlhA
MGHGFGTMLEVLGLGDYIALFLFMAHIRLDLGQIPPQPLLFIWLFGLILVALGVVLNSYEETPPEEESPQGLAEA